ncbi:hypothetical protein QX233_11240 [Chryseobacterium gambrini]|uniref:Uncharacterized protein n=1 Tax=Chryseobacterium gambrini TaxID=373672 RepID=A0AAJ1VMS5_9FLAO|nr:MULTISPECIES: hypothetical protein [Chryseobacterium]MDN4013039.1 hypothetical protein [Chryseobacterium gambrini]MDN4030075.1 hypothetical protein [Chryseobacterium gambrini]QWA40450.1 hypothetical protein KKI44_09695 [Chryseobacterium sp. ZHDP1]
MIDIQLKISSAIVVNSSTINLECFMTFLKNLLSPSYQNSSKNTYHFNIKLNLMRKSIIYFSILVCLFINGLAQTGNVGVNETSPASTLDVKTISGSNTKTFRLRNNSGSETLTVLENGNVGIGQPSPGYNLEAKGTIAFPNVLSNTLSSGYNALGIDNTTGQVGIFTAGAPPYLYGELQTAGLAFNLTTAAGNVVRALDLSSADLAVNTISATYGVAASATIDGSARSNVAYIVLPAVGYYRLDLVWYGVCSTGTVVTNSRELVGVNTTIALASSGTSFTTYTVNRNIWVADSDSAGNISGYITATPNRANTIFRTTVANTKIAVFIGYGVGDEISGCQIAKPNGAISNGSYSITKL